MPQSSESAIPESTLDRTKRIYAEIEEMISATGEHPEYELKQKWRRDNPFLKAEFVKDIQSISNSVIPPGKDKYIIVGVNETTREIVGCSHKEFDEAPIRQLLETYLDSVPEYEILYPKSRAGTDYVIIRLPHQSQKPFVTRAEIFGEKNEKFLSIGEIWLKPKGSTGKRRLTSKADILELIDTEAIVGERVQNRINQLVPEIRAEERSRIGTTGFGAVPSLTATEDEFIAYLEQVIASNETSRFNVLLQKIRDKTVESWESKIGQNRSLTAEEIYTEKQQIFLPAMRRLCLLGILIIKYTAPLEWFKEIGDLLVDIFNISDVMADIIPGEIRKQKPENLENHLNNYFPALESLMIANVLIGYEIKKKNKVVFSSTLFPRLVKVKNNPTYSSDEEEMFFLFYRFFYHSVDRRLDLLIGERYAVAGRIPDFFDGESAFRKTMLQVTALIDWLSFLSYENLTKESRTSKYFAGQYPGIHTDFNPVYAQESLENVKPFLEKIWLDLRLGEKNYYLLDAKLAKLLSTFDLSKRKEVFGRFLIEAERQHARRMHSQNRFPGLIYWPRDISIAIDSINEADKLKQLSLED